MKIKIAALAGLAAIALAGCGSAAGTQTISAQVTETGSSLIWPYITSLQAPYAKLRPQVLFVPGYSSSGTGITDAESGLVSFGASDAYLSPPVKGLVNIPLVVAGVAADYNLPGVRSLNLDGKVLAEMYSGRITRWDDRQVAALNPHVRLPDLAVRPLERSDSSGSTFLFTSYLQQQSADGWPVPGKLITFPSLASAIAEKGSDGMIAGCAKTPGCIAYVGVSYDGVLPASVRVAALRNGGGQYVLPSRPAIAAAVAQFAPVTPADGTLAMIGAACKGCYPLINYEYAIVKVRQPGASQAAAVRQFLQWVITAGNASRYLSGVNFAALPARTRAIALHLIGQIR